MWRIRRDNLLVEKNALELESPRKNIPLEQTKKRCDDTQKVAVLISMNNSYCYWGKARTILEKAFEVLFQYLWRELGIPERSEQAHVKW